MLVTGGAGFIGAELCRALAGRGVPVVALDDLSSGYAERLAGCPGPLEFELGDATDEGLLAACLRRFKVGCVVHLAARVGVRRVLSDPEAFPALHDELYDLLPRRGKPPSDGKLPTGRGNLPAERKRARELVRRLVSRLRAPAILTTSDEEIGLLRAALEERGLRARGAARARLSAIVGDPLRSYRVDG